MKKQSEVFSHQKNPVKEHINNSQSTHGKPAQASAARLLVMLRQDFSQGQSTTPQPEELNLLAEIAKSNSRTPIALEKVNNNIHGILSFINYIFDHKNDLTDDQFKNFTDEQFKTVISNIVLLAKVGTDEFTKNYYYPVDEHGNISTAPVVIDACLGETLNLVCLALLDKNAYELTPNFLEKDIQHRIFSLFNFLLNLPKICTGGIQHELLYLLNNCYKKVKLVESLVCFLREEISDYLAELIKQEITNPNELFQFLLPWIIKTAQSEIQITNDTRYERWLDQSIIREKVTKRLQQKCTEYCFNPVDTQKQIKENVDNLEYMPAPDAIHRGVSLLCYILKTNSYSDSYERIKALKTVQMGIIRCKTFDEVVNRYTDFEIAIDVNKELAPFLQLTTFIGSESKSLQVSIEALDNLLAAYYKNIVYNWLHESNLKLPPDFQQKKEAFHAAVISFKKSNYFDFIKDYFAILASDFSKHNSFVTTLKLIPKENILLTDNFIKDSLNKYSATNNIIEITPYEINRFLLHAMLVNPLQWTPLYCHTLIFIVEWLLKPTLEDNLAAQRMRDIQATYNRYFLINIYVLACIASAEFNEGSKEAIYRLYGLFPYDEHQTQQCLFTKMILGYTLCSPDITQDQSLHIWSAIKEQLSVIIQDGYQLNNIFNCKYFNDKHRAYAWNIAQPKLYDIIHGTDQLLEIFNCVHFTITQKHLIWNIVQPQLATKFIQTAPQFYHLFKCDALLTEQRALIWQATVGRFANIIHTFQELIALLTYENFTEEQRTQILMEIKGVLGTWIQNTDQLIAIRNITHLTQKQNDIIWEVIKPNLKNIIQTANQFNTLFNIYSTAEQCELIWLATQGRFTKIILRCPQLIDLLNCEKLTEVQRTQILHEIKEKIQSIMGPIRMVYRESFKMIFKCAFLTTEQLLFILHSQKHFLSNICKYEILRLSTSPKILDLLLHFIQDELGGIPGNFQELYEILQIPSITTEQRTFILNSVQDKLIKAIYSSINLETLLICNLTSEHCSLILNSIQDKLGDIIETSRDLSRLLVLSNLEHSHRCQILLNSTHLVTNINLASNLSMVFLKDFDQESISNIINVMSQTSPLPTTHNFVVVECLNDINSLFNKNILNTSEKSIYFIKNNAIILDLITSHYFTEEQRTLILNSVKNQLADLIKDKDTLFKILSYNKFTENQRKLLMDIILSNNTLAELYRSTHVSNPQSSEQSATQLNPSPLPVNETKNATASAAYSSSRFFPIAIEDDRLSTKRNDCESNQSHRANNACSQ